MSNETPNQRGWPKGRSGNPGGRAKGVEALTRIVLKTRSYTAKNGNEYFGPEAIVHMWLDIAFDADQKANDRIVAGVRAIERGYGSVKQTVKIESESSSDTSELDPEKMSTEDLREALGAIGTLKRIGGVVDGVDDDAATEH